MSWEEQTARNVSSQVGRSERAAVYDKKLYRPDDGSTSDLCNGCVDLVQLQCHMCADACFTTHVSMCLPLEVMARHLAVMLTGTGPKRQTAQAPPQADAQCARTPWVT